MEHNMRFSFNKRNKILIGVVVVVLVIGLMNVFQKEVRAFFYWFSSPIQKVLWRAGESTADFFSGVVKTGKLKQEVDQLKLKNQELVWRLENLKNLKQENQVLRQALGLELQKDYRLVLAQVISKDISQDYLLIDKGTRDGISKGMPLITEQKVLVGRISEVYEKFSKVQLLSNKENSFDADFGLVKGAGNFKLFFELIPKEIELSEGDLIFTSALGGIFPKGLLVGQVKKVIKNDVEPFQQAEIEPAFNISEAEIIFVILDF